MKLGAQKRFFTQQLLRWHRCENLRSLPWKKETDPYKIWLSEIILQQTTTKQGLPYFERFIKTYPTIEDLAAARDEEVFRLWQGLGYYNRCKNLLHTARRITTEKNGQFPAVYDEIRSLKGVGNYTAAAIASFAFHLPYAVVDGNVNRLLARFFGIEQPLNTTEGKKLIQSLADELLDAKNNAAYNQAIMDYGATVCTPAAPACNDCMLQKNCVAFRQQLVKTLPLKTKKASVKKRFFHYLILIAEDKIWIRKRTNPDIWQNLFEPLLIEKDRPLEAKDIRRVLKKDGFGNIPDIKSEGSSRQRLTHQLIETRFFTLRGGETCMPEANAGIWVPVSALKKYPFPKTVVSFFEKKLYF